MKKFSALMLILLLLITGCSTAVAPEPAAPAEPPPAPETPAAPDPRPIPPVTEDGIVEIEEDWFIAQTLTIQDNLDDYLGKTIRYEGFVFPFMDPNSKEEVINILRYGPGC